MADAGGALSLLAAYKLKTGKADSDLTKFERAWLSPRNERTVLSAIRDMTQFNFVPDEWFLSSMFSVANRFREARSVTASTLSDALVWYLTKNETEIVERSVQVHDLQSRSQGMTSEVHVPPMDVRAEYRRQKRGTVPMVGEMMFLYDEMPAPRLNGEDLEDEVDDLAWR